MTATLEREEIAKIVYDAMPYRPVKHERKPEWVPGGNSLMQDEARRAADAILALAQAKASEEREEIDQLIANATAQDAAMSQGEDELLAEITPSVQEQPVADLSPEESIEFYRLAEELGSGRMSPADLARLAARRLYATPSQTARERENG